MPSLTIVATDLTSKKIIVFNKEETPHFSVARAVRASLSLPFVFKPLVIKEMNLIDGGVLSNFPAWVFDQQRKKQKEIVPTFGFRLREVVNLQTDSNSNDNNSGFIKFINNFFATIFSGDNVLETREIEDLNLIPINVSANTLDFDLSFNDKRLLYLEGREGGQKFFYDYLGPKDSDGINTIFEYIEIKVREFLQKQKLHLRINIALPIHPQQDRLRILYPFNMKRDADDRLILGVGEGCIGNCWKDHKIYCADMSEAKTSFESKWQMSKYQQALVRQSLKSLISLPIFDPRNFDKMKNWKDNPISMSYKNHHFINSQLL
jgi:NTE family protein